MKKLRVSIKTAQNQFYEKSRIASLLKRIKCIGEDFFIKPSHYDLTSTYLLCANHIVDSKRRQSVGIMGGLNIYHQAVGLVISKLRGIHPGCQFGHSIK